MRVNGGKVISVYTIKVHGIHDNKIIESRRIKGDIKTHRVARDIFSDLAVENINFYPYIATLRSGEKQNIVKYSTKYGFIEMEIEFIKNVRW